MVSHLIRLRYLLMWNGFRRSTGAIVGAIFSTLGYLYFIAMAYVAAVVIALTPVHELSYAQRGAPFILLGAVFVIGWIVGPIVFSSTSPFTNPKNFLTYGIPNKDFIPGAVIGGMLAPTGIGTFVLLMTGAVLWGGNPAAIVAGIIAAIIGTAICVLVMQVVVGVLTNVISRRGVRDAIQILLLVPLMLAGFIVLGAIETIQQFWETLPDLAAWIAYTPAGFLALPGMVAQEQWAMAALHLVVMLAYLVVLLVAYNAIVNRATAAAGTTKERQRDKTGLGMIGRADSPMKAIWARSLLYWIKDPRYSASLLVVVVLIGIAVVQLVAIDNSEMQFIAKVVPVAIAYIIGFSISADLSYDSTGFSLHVTTGVRGVDDRLGRVFALLTWGLPLVVALTVAMAYSTGTVNELAAWLGLTIGVLLTGLAVSAIVSARYIYPAPPPGASPMAQPEGGMGRTMVIQTLGMLAQLVVALPVVVLAIIALVIGSQAWGIITLMVGVLYGAGMLWVGVRIGAKWYDRALPETYQAIVKVSALY